MTYRKLSSEELENFGMNTDKHKVVIDWVKLNYPKEAVSALVMFMSEYNDEYYNSEVQTILVYDKNGNELLPLAGKSVSARKKMPNMDYYTNPRGDGTSNQIDDLVVFLSFPELYIKE